MKIGILTLFFGNDNWGGVLQGYALKTYLELNYSGTKVDIINYHPGSNIIYTSRFKQALQYSPVEILSKVVHFKKRRGQKYEKLNARKKLFEQFRKEYTTNDNIYYDDDISKLAEEYDCLICGSDQIWNPNVGKAGFFLCGAEQKCKKISYAASIARNDLSKHEAEIMIPLIRQFDSVSVREKTAKKIIEKYNDGSFPVTEVLDPALMLTSEQWKKILPSKKQVEPYALCFFFSDSLVYRKEIEKICSKKGLKIKFIPYAKGYIKSDDYGEAERLYDVGPVEFIKLFEGAEYIFTDSFHGAAFSINFNKPFIVFERDKNTKVSKNSRLYDLLEKFELSERLIRNLTSLPALTEQKIDYCNVNLMLEKYRKYSQCFLDTALSSAVTKDQKKPETVENIDKEMCCGCGKCAEICPCGSIKMKADSEGFNYPDVDENTCVKCGKCVKFCTTMISDQNDRPVLKNTYVGYNKNAIIQKQSSSGGLFYLTAKYILEEKQGVVYGARFNNDFEVVHSRTESIDELKGFMKSKYVQSSMDSIYSSVLNDLINGRTVLFSGTPCQVSALKSYIGNKENLSRLYLVDFICHGVPSPGVWRSYLSYISKKSKNSIKCIDFRDKVHGWHNYYLTVQFAEGNKYSKSHETDPFMRSFLSDVNIRPSCYHCKFKDESYASDITLGDAWKIEKEISEWSDDTGVSLFVVRSEKGQELFEKVKESFVFSDSDFDKWANYNPSLIYPTVKPSNRHSFFDDFVKNENIVFWKQNKKMPVKKRVRYSVKCVLHCIGMDKILRK